MDTLVFNNYEIWETLDNGSCFFFAVAHQLLSHCNIENFDLNDLEGNELRTYIKNWDGKYKSEDYDDEVISSFAEYLQTLIYHYIQKNQNELINIGFETTIENGIFIIHEITFNEYLERYKYFSGNNIKINNLKNDDRWGSTLEQAILAKILGINIAVYTPQIFIPSINKYKSSIYKNGKFQSNTIFKLINLFNSPHNYSNLTINLIWKKFYGKGHYLGLLIC